MASTILPWHSLKNRITLTTLLIFLLSLWSLSFYASQMLRKDMERLLGEQQFSTVSILAAQINRELESRLQTLEMVAGMSGHAMHGESAAMQTFIEQRPEVHSLFSVGTFATRADGISIAFVPFSEGRIGINYMDRDYIVAALKEGKATIGRPVMGRTALAPVLVMAAPIRDIQGNVIGALAGSINLSIPNFLDQITESRYGKTGGYLLVDRKHRQVVTASDKNRVMEIFPAPGISPMIDSFVEGFEGSVVFVNPHGVEVLTSHKIIPVTGWYVAASLPTAEAFAPIYEMQQRMLLATLLLTLLAGLLSSLMLRRQLAPLLSTANKLAALSDTNLPMRTLPISKQDEIGQLIGGFNRLLETLGKREKALQESGRLLVEAQHIAGIGSYVLDVPTGLWVSSEVFDQKFGIDESYDRSVEGWLAMVHPDDRAMMLGYLRDEVIGKGRPFDKIYRIIRQQDQTVRWAHGLGKLEFDVHNHPTIMHGTIQDITERKQAEEKINQLAFFDQLTDLPNRTLLQDRLKQAMATSARSGSYGALLLIDLDHFKTLNDTLGHDMGDLLLKLVAQRLSECVRVEDTVARLGGDEFVVMLVNLSESQSEAATRAELVGEKIIAALNQIYQLKEIAYSITPSIGASVFLGQQTEIDTVVKQADLAMYKAKDAGRNTLRFFDPDMARVVMKRASLENELREAIQKQQFVLHYQAQVAGNQVTGAEALVRWQHPQRALVAPAEFISLAEETGLILPLGRWVLETACQQLTAWAARPEMSHLTIAVNVSALQFHQSDFVDQVLMVLKTTAANPERLKLELTESLLVSNVEEVIEKMLALKGEGVGFALDDFGTGFSSLSYLKRLPLDLLKIDRSFVRDVLSDPNDASIAKTIINLAESLELGVIAEGVETATQCDFLARAGCHAYQGYFFSRPLPIEGFEQFAQQVLPASEVDLI